MTRETDALHHLADAYRVTTRYLDWNDVEVEVPEATVKAVLEALGVDTSDPAAALRLHREESRSRLIAPTVMAVAGEAATIPLPLDRLADVAVTITLEDGNEIRLDDTALDDTALDRTRPDAPSSAHPAEDPETTLTLPADLPLGYHRLHVRTRDRSADAHLIVTPATLALPAGLDERSGWGFAAQLYSARSRDSWGVGDLADLATLGEWSAGLGADYVLINPVHAAEPVAPLEPSPYLPSSRRFVNPLYLRPELLPEFSAMTDDARAAVEALAAEVHEELDGQDVIDRDTSWTAKRAALELIHRVPRTPEREAAYRRFRCEQGESLERFATWNALAVEHGNDARQWPDVFRCPESPAVDDYRREHETEVDFEMWLQWQLDEQLAEVQSRSTAAGMRLGLLLDLAVGVHPGGADAWRMGETYASGIRVGAPPDAFNQRGQDWQQPPWRPDRLAELGYAPLRDLIAQVLRHSGGVRIDHIIGLFRLWWVPDGASPADGTYVRYDHEAMIGILVLEATRANAVVVGEDLGVVEDSARAYLRERGILGTSILWFERGEEGDPLPAEQWRELCLASTTTHDLPPNAGYLTGEHVELRDRLGLLTRPVEEEKEAAAEERDSWLDEVRSRGLLSDDADVDATVLALHRYLALAPSRLLGVALVDAVGDRRTQNQPGTRDEYPNWRVPLSGPDGSPLFLEDVIASDRPGAFARAVTERGSAKDAAPTSEAPPPRVSTPDPEPHIPELETDETVPPRPEEEVADVLRARPDLDTRSAAGPDSSASPSPR